MTVDAGHGGIADGVDPADPPEPDGADIEADRAELSAKGSIGTRIENTPLGTVTIRLDTKINSLAAQSDGVGIFLVNEGPLDIESIRMREGHRAARRHCEVDLFRRRRGLGADRDNECSPLRFFSDPSRDRRNPPAGDDQQVWPGRMQRHAISAPMIESADVDALAVRVQSLEQFEQEVRAL